MGARQVGKAAGSVNLLNRQPPWRLWPGPSKTMFLTALMHVTGGRFAFEGDEPETILPGGRRIAASDIDLNRLDDPNIEALFRVVFRRHHWHIEPILDQDGAIGEPPAAWVMMHLHRLQIGSDEEALDRLLAALRPQSPSE
jgi:hypothetical protein